MKSFLTVLKFELLTMVRKKSFIVSTILIVAVAFIALSIPRYSSMFEGLMQGSDEEKTIMIYDEHKVLKDKDIVKNRFQKYTVEFVDSADKVEKAVKEQTVEAGFVVNSETSFTYYVENSSIADANTSTFESILSTQYQTTQLSKKGYNVSEIDKIYNTPIESKTTVLGTDGVNNYVYTYVLIIVLFMMIMLYGNQIGVGVASEKSNRAIEILTTSCSSNALIFGKVIAGAITGIVQTVCIIGSFLIAYKLNADGWNHMMDAYFNIPMNVLLTFAVFGILGYLLYSFLFGAIGALVSKTEEVNGATMPIQMLMMASYFLAFITMSMPESLLSKIVSFIPFTSSICMFVNVAMGAVSTVEIIISLAILVITTILMGLIGAKLYRRGTMSYGNSAKLKNIVKMIKQKE